MIVKTYNIENISKKDLTKVLNVFENKIDDYIIKNNKIVVLGNDNFNHIEFKKILDFVSIK